MGNGWSSPIYTKILAYTGAGCSGTPDELEYHHGLAVGQLASGTGEAVAGTSLGYNGVFLEHGSVNPPVVSSLSQTQGGWGGGYFLQITGTDFRDLPYAPTVMVGNVPCDVVGAVTSTTIDCILDNTTDTSAIGSAQDVVVQNPGGQSDTLFSSFTFVDDGMGNAADSDTLGSQEHIISASITDTSTEPLGSRIFAANRNVTSITVSGGTTSFTLGGGAVSASEFDVGDELMWHVSAASSNSDCNGTTLPRGSYDMGRVTSVSSNVVIIDTLFPGTPDNASISSTSRTNTDSAFCVIQIVRVPNFMDLTMDATSGDVTVEPPSFSMAAGKGGILAVRVSGYFQVLGSNFGYISAMGKGFAGGVGGGQGDSLRGGARFLLHLRKMRVCQA